MCFCIKCTINPRPNPYSGVPAVRVFFLEVLACQRGLPSPAPWAFFVGLPGPHPAHFFCVKRNGKRKHTRGYPWTPSAQSANAKDWAAPLTATIKMRLSALKKRFLLPWAAGKLQGHGKRNAFFREANAPSFGVESPYRSTGLEILLKNIQTNCTKVPSFVQQVEKIYTKIFLNLCKKRTILKHRQWVKEQ